MRLLGVGVVMSQLTTYTEWVAGDRGNYKRPVRFDKTGQHIGVTQDCDGTYERILLSPDQVKKLLAFARRRR